MREGHATVSDVMDYFAQYIPDQTDTIVVLHSGDTTELEGAISMETVLEDLGVGGH